MTITLTWNDPDDLDLHVQPIEPSLPEIYYGRRKVTAPDGSVFTLDFDMNAQRELKIHVKMSQLVQEHLRLWLITIVGGV